MCGVEMGRVGSDSGSGAWDGDWVGGREIEVHVRSSTLFGAVERGLGLVDDCPLAGGVAG